MLCVEILFDATCGNIDRNPFTVLLQMKERVLYVETVTVKRVMHYVWKHSFSYFNQDKLCWKKKKKKKKENVLYVETITVKRVMHYVWKHAFSYFN